MCRLDHRAALGVGTASASRGTRSGIESGNEFVTMVFASLHDHNFVHHTPRSATEFIAELPTALCFSPLRSRSHDTAES